MAEGLPAITVPDLLKGFCEVLLAQAWQKMGLVLDPVTGEIVEDLAQARLAIDSAAKTVRFEEGQSNLVNRFLSFNQATLRSTSEGQYWFLTLDASASQDVQNVWVKDSHAGGGQTLNAQRGGRNFGHNVNWIFNPPGTYFIYR